MDAFPGGAIPPEADRDDVLDWDSLTKLIRYIRDVLPRNLFTITLLD